MAQIASSFLFSEAVHLHQSGAIHEAVSRYRQVVANDPTNADAVRLLSIAYSQLGQLDEAVALLRKAIRRFPENTLLQSLLGESLLATNRAEEALQCFNRALTLHPQFVEAFASRGNALAALNRHLEAIASFDNALAEKPDFVEVYLNRGNSFRALKRFDEAIQSYDTAIRIRPDMVEAHFSRGLVLEDQYRLSDAVESFDRALTLSLQTSPWLGQIHGHRAISNHHLGNFEEALTGINRAIALSPNDDEIVFNAAMMELLQGRWLKAWPKYEHRLRLEQKLPIAKKDADSRLPIWNGEPLKDDLLILKGEYGIGDQIQFCCYAAELAKRGMRIGLWVKPGLVELLKSVPNVEQVFSTVPHIKDKKARWLHMTSLPRLLGTTIESIPQVVPFLSANPTRIAKWQSWLGTNGLKVGIIWQGDPSYRMDRDRSIPLREFAPLAAIPNVRLISLQKNPGGEQISEVSFSSKIEKPDERFDTEGTFVDSAAIMTNLDLIVTSDTSAAHLAGALGRPVFIALPLVPDWRWLLDRADSPWYPSAHLFRQTERGKWTDVFARIAQAVGQRTNRA